MIISALIISYLLLLLSFSNFELKDISNYWTSYGGLATVLLIHFANMHTLFSASCPQFHVTYVVGQNER